MENDRPVRRRSGVVQTNQGTLTTDHKISPGPPSIGPRSITTSVRVQKRNPVPNAVVVAKVMTNRPIASGQLERCWGVRNGELEILQLFAGLEAHCLAG